MNINKKNKRCELHLVEEPLLENSSIKSMKECRSSSFHKGMAVPGMFIKIIYITSLKVGVGASRLAQ